MDGGGGAGIVATKSNDPENHCRQDFQLQLRVGGGVQGIKGQKKGAETKKSFLLGFDFVISLRK